MNREDIIRMAHEADLCNEVGEDDYTYSVVSQLERFAALVAAAEREACAKVCEAIDEGIRDHEDVAACAAAIRARGNT